MPDPSATRRNWSRFAADYGMVGVLLVLCAFCSYFTIDERDPQGAAAGQLVAKEIAAIDPAPIGVVILVNEQNTAYANDLDSRLQAAGIPVATKATGDARQLRKTLEQWADRPGEWDLIATTRTDRRIVEDVQEELPEVARAAVVAPDRYLWPTFLTWSNLLNVANRNVVVAVLAVGMTMVIITGGIDLSVGSLVAFSAVVAATLIARYGGREATLGVMLGASLAAIGLSAAIGAFSGTMISLFKVPPFVATLAMMWVASGLAFRISGGKSIADIPESYNWLGGGATLFGIPNTLILMAFIFVVGHIVMSRTVFGRHVYAVGGNRLAARLSGIRVNRVLLAVYVIAGSLAGVGGVMLASQFLSGVANYGRMYELHAIAAVVVGGTSLAGGEGKISGTLIGVFVIAVVQNAMNLMEIHPYSQDVVLGLILLGVVLLDMFKRHGWRRMLTPE